MVKSKRPRKPSKAELKKKMIAAANKKHDLEHGINPEIPQYCKEYIQGTGMRQSK